MQEQVCMNRFFQGSAKGRHQGGRQFADEPDRVGDDDLTAAPARVIRQMNLARGGVERRKQLIGREAAGVGECIEQRRFAGVGVAHQRHRKHPRAIARTALHGALALQFFEFFAQQFDAHAEQAPVGFQLRLARAAQTNAAFLPLQVGPATHQARRQVLQLRQLDLNLALVALGALRENIQDQRRAIHHPRLQMCFEIALLRRCEDVIEHHHFRPAGGDGGGDLLHLAAAGIQGRIRLLAAPRHQRLLFQAGTGTQEFEFGHRIGLAALAKIERDQYGAVGRSGCGSGFSGVI